MGSKIEHISYHLSSTEVSNEDLAKDFPLQTAEKITKNIGIKKRYMTTEDVIGSDLAFNAAQLFFKESKVKKEDVDFVLFCSEGLDYIAPMTACLLQDRLGLKNGIGALDLPGGCSGFTNAIGMAKAIIESEQSSNVLLLFGDVLGLLSHPDDYPSRALFSDAGAAVWVKKSKENQIGKLVYGSDGSGMKHLFVDRSGLRSPVDEKWLSENKEAGGMPRGQIRMNGIEVFNFLIQKVPILVKEILAKNNLAMEDIDLFVFHQASNMILKAIERKLKIEEGKMAYYIENNGNTVSVSIPLALREAEKEGRLKKGNKVLIAGYGVGFSWSGTVLYY